ncbi:YgdI/YgdR family lipoprotein [Streptomyces sp. GMY02]|uniref:YgdI/YgdR family lipoprotein n=1 Tax=Streptomyces sp. GMY02 TaxID=1333528 RepID=UPI001C2CB56A|nr:YgdI/YgdR family lipoprotein [Streptomyces sp. GMY02]QXE34287.1 YgdI/YgdR family lipoprotein [Streptomyces sp. GMY02]
MKRIKRTATAVALTASALLVSACSSGTAPETAKNVADGKPIVNKENWPKKVPVSGLTKDLTLPLEAYMASYEDQVTVEQAANDLQQSCLKDYGIDLTLPRAGANPPPSDNDANIERRYGITDRAEAEKYGYELPPALQQHIEQPMRDLSGVEVEVLTGHTKPELPNAPEGVKAGGAFAGPGQGTKPARAEYNGKKLKTGGCIGWSKDQLGVKEADPIIVAQLAGDSLVKSMKDDKVIKAVAAWSSCMDGKGHAGLADPYKAMDQGVTHDGEPSQESIALAVDDIDCKEQTDLVKIWSGAESAIQDKQIADNKSRLAGIKEQHGKEVAAAREQMTASSK